MASNIELISLYLQINQKIIEEDGGRNASRHLRRVTADLLRIKETLDKIEIRINFSHPWFPAGKFLSFWHFYNYVNSIHDNIEEMP